MQDEEIDLCNACSDLVTLKKAEAFPRRLLSGKPPGEWVGVRDFCGQIGVDVPDLPDLFAAWLPDPKAHNNFVLILFYDDESKWSMAAHYNRARLDGDANRAGQPSVAAVSPATHASPQPAPPTANV